jgi:hypothetical protein
VADGQARTDLVLILAQDGAVELVLPADAGNRGGPPLAQRTVGDLSVQQLFHALRAESAVSAGLPNCLGHIVHAGHALFRN